MSNTDQKNHKFFLKYWFSADPYKLSDPKNVEAPPAASLSSESPRNEKKVNDPEDVVQPLKDVAPPPEVVTSDSEHSHRSSASSASRHQTSETPEAPEHPQDVELAPAYTEAVNSSSHRSSTSSRLQDSESPEALGPQEDLPWLDLTINFILDHWKIILALGGSLILFLIAFFMVLFLVILKSDTVATTSAPITNSTMTTRPSTVSMTTVTTTVSNSTTNRPTTTSMTTTKAATTTTIAPTTVSTTLSTKIPTKTPKVEPAPTMATNSMCTNAFTMVNDKCLKLIPTHQTRTNAAISCQQLAGGATLIFIENAEENDAIGAFLAAQNQKKAWIALECSLNNKTSCIWDYRPGTYSNFAKGFPNVNFGHCVYYLTSEMRWVSGECDSDEMGFVCELPVTTKDHCTFNFNNYCYTYHDLYMTFDDAETYCNTNCGHLVSIHSELENRFISHNQSLDFTMLGGVAPAEDLIMWSDKSSRDFNNLGSFDEKMACLGMNLSNGRWYTADCSEVAYFICKRQAGLIC